MRFIRVGILTAFGTLQLQMAAILVLVAFHHEHIVETCYSPAFALADLFTPDSLQFNGNILLGFTWLCFSAVLYACAFGLLAGLTTKLANQRLQLTGCARD